MSTDLENLCKSNSLLMSQGHGSRPLHVGHLEQTFIDGVQHVQLQGHSNAEKIRSKSDTGLRVQLHQSITSTLHRNHHGLLNKELLNLEDQKQVRHRSQGSTPPVHHLDSTQKPPRTPQQRTPQPRHSHITAVEKFFTIHFHYSTRLSQNTDQRRCSASVC